MKIYEANSEMYQHTLLPAFANFILNRFIDDYTRNQIELAKQLDIPLLKHFQHLSEAELFAFSKEGAIEWLTDLADNHSKQYVEKSMRRWMANQIPNMQRMEVEARDITLINYLRGKGLKFFISRFTADVPSALSIIQEIDDFLTGITTTSFDVYIEMLKEKINEEARFSNNLIQASPGLTYIFDLQAEKEIFITGKVLEVMGYTADEVLSMNNLAAELCHPDDRQVLADLLQDLKSDVSDSTHIADYRFKNKFGKYVWLRSYIIVYKRNHSGVPEQVLGVAYNIDKEKEVTLALQKSEKNLLEAQQIGQIGSFEWDLIEDNSETSPQLRKIFEIDKRQNFEEIVGKVHPEDKDRLRNAITLTLETGHYHCEYRYLAPSGEKIIDSKGIVSYNISGLPATLIGTIQDITKQKHTQLELEKQKAELERSNEALQQFAYAASHDLKEPLRKIAMFSEMVGSADSDKISERSKEYLEKIQKSAQRLQIMVDGVLEYSAIQFSDTSKEKVQLEKVIQVVKNNLEVNIQESGASIETDSLPEIIGYSLQLERLFQNLMSNSLKFAKPGVRPSIQITHNIESPEKMDSANGMTPEIIIKYSDNGIGFNPESAENIFDIFKRLHSRAQYEGSGVGLAICKKIVQAHNGSIVASGVPGEGASFTIRLPLVSSVPVDADLANLKTDPS